MRQITSIQLLTVGVLLILVLLSGCTQQEIPLNTTSALIGNASCLDPDNNSVCDNNESVLQNQVNNTLEYVAVAGLIGRNGSDGNLESFEMMVNVVPDSEPIALNSTIITFDTKNSTQNLYYDGLYGIGTPGPAKYTVKYLKNGTNHSTDYLSSGDLVTFYFTSTYPIYPTQTVKARIIPKHGRIVPIDLIMPSNISKESVVVLAHPIDFKYDVRDYLNTK